MAAAAISQKLPGLLCIKTKQATILCHNLVPEEMADIIVLLHCLTGCDANSARVNSLDIEEEAIEDEFTCLVVCGDKVSRTMGTAQAAKWKAMKKKSSINDKPHPPTWGGVGDMWGLGHTICAPWWGKVQLTVWGSKFNFFNMWHAIHCKKNLPGVGVGEWWGKGHCCNAPWGGGGLSLICALIHLPPCTRWIACVNIVFVPTWCIAPH